MSIKRKKHRPSKKSSAISQSKHIKLKLKIIQDKKPTKNSKEFFTNILEIIYIVLFNYFRVVGLYTIKIARKIKRVLTVIYNHTLKRPVEGLQHLILRFVRNLRRLYKFIVFKLYMFFKFFFDAKDVIVKGYRKKTDANIFIKICYAIGAFFSGVFNNRRIFTTWLNYALPIVSIIIMINLVEYATDLNFAVSVVYNDDHVGYIDNEQVFDQAETKLQQRVTYLEGDEVIDNIPQFELMVVPSNRLKDDLQLTDALMKSSGKELVKATGITIDDKFYGAVENGYVVRQSLDGIKDAYKTDGVISAEFVNDIQYDTALYLADNIKEEQDMIDILSKEEEQEVFVEILEGDSPSVIAERNGLTLDDFVKLNPGITESCVVGRLVKVKRSKSHLPVSVTKSETYIEAIPFKTTTTKSSSIYNGIKDVKKEGEKGEREVTATIKYVDDVEIDRDIISENIIKEAVTEEVIVGTGGYAQVSGYDGPQSDSGFIWPTYGGYVSSPFGKRGWSFHSGIDYATNYGTPVVAALPGKVIQSSYHSSYGNLVKIDHGAGLQTWYAHNSKLLVRAGQMVEQGQVISKVGSTGRSTGNHLHFEVVMNGLKKNPMQFLPQS